MYSYYNYVVIFSWLFVLDCIYAYKVAVLICMLKKQFSFFHSSLAEIE